ncbi:LRR receptor-like serine/threonine-protein kinase GSO1 [Camellia lanceoleosa]|uniref:LRR receptor-like serine/threonine-protein kinase GSO1 n=1 Tax=Camellia lanceoleosa TaxID=1840588 RepID=A0ACC0H847_9ERIC|nr:LRR receptor-like serine/threonine-protein kinase GSO1 [Camellia lanceoleosa]
MYICEQPQTENSNSNGEEQDQEQRSVVGSKKGEDKADVEGHVGGVLANIGAVEATGPRVGYDDLPDTDGHLRELSMSRVEETIMSIGQLDCLQKKRCTWLNIEVLLSKAHVLHCGNNLGHRDSELSDPMDQLTKEDEVQNNKGKGKVTYDSVAMETDRVVTCYTAVVDQKRKNTTKEKAKGMVKYQRKRRGNIQIGVGSVLNFKKGVEFRSAAAAISLSMASKSGSGQLLLTEAETSLKIGKLLGLKCKGKDEEGVSVAVIKSRSNGNEKWDLSFRRALFQWELEELRRMRVLLQNAPELRNDVIDRLSWDANRIGCSSRQCVWSVLLLCFWVLVCSAVLLSAVDWAAVLECCTACSSFGVVVYIFSGFLHLKYLDLSGNDFTNIPFPPVIASMTQLQYINLSNAGFVGTIPHQLGNLSSLRSLSLPSSMNVENLQWLAGLSRLEHLDLSGVNLVKVPNWLQVINNLPFLVELRLVGCELDHFPPFLSAINFTSLAVLDLSGNQFGSLIPGWIFSLGSLVYLDLSYCNLIGPISKCSWNLTSLETLDVSYNDLNSSLLNSLFSTTNSLVYLSLTHSGFQGPFPTIVPNMTNLSHLDLSSNSLNSTIPSWLYSFSRLEVLDLGFNRLEGGISNEIGNLTSAIFLSLSRNNIEGRLPNSIGNLASLYSLDLSYNGLEGRLPNSIGNLASLEILELSYNGLEESLPRSLGNLCNLRHIGLSHNKFSGELFTSSSKCIAIHALEDMLLDVNKFSGHIPDQIGQFQNLTNILLSDTLFFTDIQTQMSPIERSVMLHRGSPRGFRVSTEALPPDLGALLRFASVITSPAFLLSSQGRRGLRDHLSMAIGYVSWS